LISPNLYIMKVKLLFCIGLFFLTTINSYSQDSYLDEEQTLAKRKFETLKKYLNKENLEVYEFDFFNFIDQGKALGISYSVALSIRYPGTNDYNKAYSKGEFIFKNITGIKSKKKKIVLSFNSNGYNTTTSYMGSPWKVSKKYKLNIHVEDKKKRKEMIEVFKVFINNPYCSEE